MPLNYLVQDLTETETETQTSEASETSDSQICRPINIRQLNETSSVDSPELPKPLPIHLSAQEKISLESSSPYRVLDPLQCVKINDLFYYVSPTSRDCHLVKDTAALAGFNVLTTTTEKDPDADFFEMHDSPPVELKPENCVRYKKHIFLVDGENLRQITNPDFLKKYAGYRFMKCSTPNENTPLNNLSIYRSKMGETAVPSPLNPNRPS